MNLHYALWQSLSLLDFQTLQILPLGVSESTAAFFPRGVWLDIPGTKRGDELGLRSATQVSSQRPLMC